MGSTVAITELVLILLALPIIGGSVEYYPDLHKEQPVNILDTDIVYYDISGSTEEELQHQMYLLGPGDDDGKRGWAYTNWRFSWGWGYNENCQLTNVHIDLTIKVLLPRWTPPKDASLDLITEWNNLFRAISEHENGHVKIAKDNVGMVYTAIKGSNCNSANSEANFAVNNIRQLQKEYEAKTNHGATQGVTFGSITRDLKIYSYEPLAAVVKTASMSES